MVFDSRGRWNLTEGQAAFVPLPQSGLGMHGNNGHIHAARRLPGSRDLTSQQMWGGEKGEAQTFPVYSLPRAAREPQLQADCNVPHHRLQSLSPVREGQMGDNEVMLTCLEGSSHVLLLAV